MLVHFPKVTNEAFTFAGLTLPLDEAADHISNIMSCPDGGILLEIVNIPRIGRFPMGIREENCKVGKPITSALRRIVANKGPQVRRERAAEILALLGDMAV